jgi:competence protein ComEA
MSSFFDILFTYLKQYYLLMIIIILLIVNLYFSINKTIIENVSTEESNVPITMGMDQVTSDTNQVNNIYKVDIKGEVKKAGVYEVNDKMVVNDVINLAGGLTKSADTRAVNLSKRVSNEMVIYIASKKEITSNATLKNDAPVETNNAEGVITKSASEQASNAANIININTATLEQLDALPSIGTAKAQSIIEYRQTNGIFTSIDDIKKVSGIGDSLFAKIKNYITV